MINTNIKYKNFVIYGIIFTTTIILSLVILFFIQRKKNSEKFCNCQGMDTKVCPNPEMLQALYSAGILTENTNLQNGPSIWKFTSEPTVRFHHYPENKTPICK